MKNNTRTVLISVVGITVAIGVMVIVGLRMAGRIGERVRQESDTRSATVQEVTVERDDTEEVDRRAVPVLFDEEFTDFTSIVVTGGWTLTLLQGSDYLVDVTASERAMDEVYVYQRGDELRLSIKSGIGTVTGNLKAIVTVPDLDRIQIDGGVTGTIEAFETDELEIEVDGAASIRALDCDFGKLDIDVDGAATLDFWESSVRDVFLEMDGAAQLSVTMDGGDLAGVIRGVGQVTYRGEVDDEDVDVEGLGRVRRR
jgi:hypothetical protein